MASLNISHVQLNCSASLDLRAAFPIIIFIFITAPLCWTVTHTYSHPVPATEPQLGEAGPLCVVLIMVLTVVLTVVLVVAVVLVVVLLYGGSDSGSASGYNSDFDSGSDSGSY